MPQALSSVNLLWSVGIPHDSIERTEERGIVRVRNVFEYRYFVNYVFFCTIVLFSA